MQLNDLGTDFNSDYTFVDGDIQLINDTENLIQSITNRLNTPLNSMNSFYYNYGSLTRQYLGEKTTKRMLEFLELEVKRTLEQDPRLEDVNVDVELDHKGVINIFVSKIFSDDTDLSLNLVLKNDGNGVDIIGD